MMRTCRVIWIAMLVSGGLAAAARTPPSWKEIDRMASEQKLEAAAKAAEERLRAAQEASDDAEWARALVRTVQLRIGLHGYETAVRFLRAEKWPQGMLPRAALQLYYASALTRYAQMYQWEIRQRERVESREPVDLKAWTLEQIHTEAERAFEELWQAREALGQEPVGKLSEYLTAGNYPPGIRDTLRDAVTYLRVEHLADSSFWRPEHSSELYRLDLPALIQGDPGKSARLKLTEPAVHPLLRLGALLDDLEQWHRARGKRESALEARLQRAQVLNRSFSEASDRELIRKDLEARLKEHRQVPWFAAGMAVLAELTRDGGELARARQLALEGRKAYPGSVGGQRCAHLAASIEAPDFQIASMSTDGPGRRSLEISAKNLPALHFRAYSMDLERVVAGSRDYNLLPEGQEIRNLLGSRSPAYSWTVKLPATPDFKPHQTYVTPPITRKGLYVVLASAREDFAIEGQNRISAVNLVVSGLVLVIRDERGEGVEVSVLSGESGTPAAGAEVRLYRLNYQRGHELVATEKTDPRGAVRFRQADPRSSYIALARKDGDATVAAQSFSLSASSQPGEAAAALVFTDRSVYRPLQKVLFKVVAFRGKEARYRVSAGAEVTVSLQDPNHQVVETKELRTNEYGSASGEFTIPTGRLLGGWQISTAPQGSSSIRVEEYKRPTFEVSFKDAEKPMRLNQPATLAGEARYYFGLPVTSGSVKWRVVRSPVYPNWWGWMHWGRAQPGTSQVIASGTSSLGDDGSFRFTFNPAADERQRADSGVTFRYEASADVTDDGGETRSATRSVRLGMVAVEARVALDEAFLREGRASSLTIVRTDLGGVGRAGKGSWRLFEAKQPSEAVLPADEPVPTPPEAKSEFLTPGDRLRPRWQAQYTPQATLRSWADGAERAKGSLLHGENGEARLELPSLPPGAYRIRYETVDDFGARYQTSEELVVAGRSLPLELPAVLLVERATVKVGETARLLAHSGFAGQPLVLEVYRGGRRVDQKLLAAGKDAALIELAVGPEDRGGFAVTLTTLRDYQLMHFSAQIFVPWEDKELKVELSTFRDRIRPGAKETWRVTVRGGTEKKPEAVAAELLAYMYDQSLDIFGPHSPPSVSALYPRRTLTPWVQSNLGQAWAQWIVHGDLATLPPYQGLYGERLKLEERYGIGGPGARYPAAFAMRSASPAPRREALQEKAVDQTAERSGDKRDQGHEGGAGRKDRGGEESRPQIELRTDFSETAFFLPHLLTSRDGSAAIEFTAPDSVTAWNVWVHALTKDLRGGSVSKKTRSVKELMVRPYLPRFLREGDSASIKVVINNASQAKLQGELRFEIIDPETEQSLLAEFQSSDAGPRAFSAGPGKNATLTFPITAPRRVGPVAFRITARAGDLSDGELRPLPVLPSRMHLVQSRFVTLAGKDRRTLSFPEMAAGADPTLTHERLVVTVDAQLFYSVLGALPYLVSYPYECTEQTLNRFVSTGIVSTIYRDYPAVARMAEELSKRETRLETFDAADPNRKMALEETPWLIEAKGGKHPGVDQELINVLNPKIAAAERATALAKLRKSQTALGGFPWWPGGPPSPYMTLYITHGLARAAEMGVEVPKEMVLKAWQYLAAHFRQEYAARMLEKNCCWEFLTFLNYVATSFPDASWTGEALTQEERKKILALSFRHWTEHSPYLKGYLALTLKRMGRAEDARRVFESVMDSAKTTRDEGTFWAPEDRAWLWYNDTIETHAFALRTLLELSPQDPRRHGLVQWLLVNKKLSHWKSTKATAEVIYSLVKYLQAERALAVREESTVALGTRSLTMVFEPDRYTGKKNQIVVPGSEIEPRSMSTITVEKESKGFQFASATWHFATDKLPQEGRGDLFSVSRSYFRREKSGREAVLRPLAEGAKLEPGDEVEVRLSLRSRHAAEYVHLRDPRAAGLEPENAVSRYKWDLGIGWYEEVRDSGSNFFFEWLPAGEYSFRYRLRANLGGTFRVGPATVQSMYAPDFAAYSAGHVLSVATGGK